MARYFLKKVGSIYFCSLNKDPNLFAALVATQKSIAQLQWASILVGDNATKSSRAHTDETCQAV